ncbi:MAG: cation diffusion facilitator family transporter, partial [bacterium]|nr:cation diffusion facilitator family transporter [bacterium]
MSGNHHQHSEILPSTAGRLVLTMLLNFIITAVEIIGGIISGSLSLIADALHNFSDGVAVIITYAALKLKSRKKSYRHTFGLKRAEILAAVINSSVLVVISLYLFYEAARRFTEPQQVTGGLMTTVAAVGLIANVIGTLLLRRDSQKSINIKTAYLHLFSDALSSVGVVLGGIAIHFWHIYWIDPALTIAIGIYILKQSYQILMQAVHILMEGAPADISLTEIQARFKSIPEVKDIHHVHIWSVGEND